MIKKRNDCVLRDFREDDVEKKVEWINDPNNNEYLHYDIPLSCEKTKEWFLKKDNTNRVDCVIEYRGTPVGVIGLLNIDRANKKAEYYITIGEKGYKQCGIAFLATQMILEYAIDDLGLHKVYLNVDEDNIAACRLYEKTGFVCEGVFREDMLRKGQYINRRRYAFLEG